MLNKHQTSSRQLKEVSGRERSKILPQTPFELFALQHTHIYTNARTHTHLNCLHPAGLFDLVVDDGSVLTDRLIPCSQTDGVLGKRERERKICVVLS